MYISHVYCTMSKSSKGTPYAFIFISLFSYNLHVKCRSLFHTFVSHSFHPRYLILVRVVHSTEHTLQEESHTIDLISIQIDKCETYYATSILSIIFSQTWLRLEPGLCSFHPHFPSYMCWLGWDVDQILFQLQTCQN